MQIPSGQNPGLLQALTAYFQAPAHTGPKLPAKAAAAEIIPEPAAEETVNPYARRGTYLDITV